MEVRVLLDVTLDGGHELLGAFVHFSPEEDAFFLIPCVVPYRVGFRAVGGLAEPAGHEVSLALVGVVLQEVAVDLVDFFFEGHPLGGRYAEGYYTEIYEMPEGLLTESSDE